MILNNRLYIKSYDLSTAPMLDKSLLRKITNQFWNEIFTNELHNKHLLILCKVHYTEDEDFNGYKTLGHLLSVNNSDKDKLIEYLVARLGILSEGYTSNYISKIAFTYIIKDGLANETHLQSFTDLSDKKVSGHSFNNYILPISMDPADYGTIRNTSTLTTEEGTITRYSIISNKKRVYEIDVSSENNKNIVRILGPADLQWTDIKCKDGFKRLIGHTTKYFLDGEEIYREIQLPSKQFRKYPIDRNKKQKFITIDIETIRDESGKLVPYLICAFDGKKHISSFNSDPQIMFDNFITELLKLNSYQNNIIYAHNLSSFDGIFILKYLMNHGKITPLYFNSKLMQIELELPLTEGSSNPRKLIFRDSFLLLPLSLRKLCEAFSVEVSKSWFPFGLNDLNYEGDFPDYKYWSGLDIETYNVLLAAYIDGTKNRKNFKWNFKDVSISYCERDCVSLHQVISKFNDLIWEEFKVNITKCITLPSLAMKIYKTHYMPKDTIYQLHGEVEQAIRCSYTGGAVDVYIPQNQVGEKLYYYDVNSLYPTIMNNIGVPTGKPIFFEGDLRKIYNNDEICAFVYCKITSPLILNQGVSFVDNIFEFTVQHPWYSLILGSFSGLCWIILKFDNISQFIDFIKPAADYLAPWISPLLQSIYNCYIKISTPIGEFMNKTIVTKFIKCCYDTLILMTVAVPSVLFEWVKGFFAIFKQFLNILGQIWGDLGRQFFNYFKDNIISKITDFFRRP
jgi:hypothetical protein